MPEIGAENAGAALLWRTFAGISLLLALTLARADQDDLRKIEARVADNPRGVVNDAGTQWRQARSGGDKRAQLRALRILASAHLRLDEYPGLRDDADNGVPLARELGDMEALAQFLAGQAPVEWNDGRVLEATKLYDEAIALAEQGRFESMLAKIQMYKGRMFKVLGRHPDALTSLYKAYSVFESRSDKLWMSSALAEIAGVFSAENATSGDLARAIDYYKRALELVDAVSHRFVAADLYQKLGVTYQRLSDLPQAKTYLQRSLAVASELKEPMLAARSGYHLAILHKEERRFAEALAHIDDALPAFMESGNVNAMFLGHLARAEILAMQKRKTESLDSLDRARSIVLRLGSPRDALYHETAAKLHAEFRDYEEAYRQMDALRKAERRRSEAADARLAGELRSRFDVQLRESENALLRSQKKESDARRLVLVLVLLLALIVLCSGAFFLAYQIREKRRFVVLAMRDELTGVPNRRSILEFGRIQLGAGRTLGYKFCLAILDIDHFKRVNDTYGHDAGDAVLVAFAHACQGQLRSNDRLGRIGGEEFVLVMPGGSASQVPVVFERLRAAVKQLRMPGIPPEHVLSFSMGAAEATSSTDSLDDLVKRADEALYRAKQAGRDGFAIAPR